MNRTLKYKSETSNCITVIEKLKSQSVLINTCNVNNSNGSDVMSIVPGVTCWVD